MSLNSPKDILNSYGILPSKSFGQNFLINRGILDKIVRAADIKEDDTIVEVGPGLGVLTMELAKKAKRVIAVEKDRKMVEILKERLKDLKNVEIIHADALKLSSINFSLPIGYKVVANLPYNVATAIIRMFLENPPLGKQPGSMTLMVQKEVGQRICAKPPEMSILSISVQIYGKPEIISKVSAGSFWPMPKVDSAILKITNIHNPEINTKLFFQILKAGFSQPRKQIGGNLAKGLKLNKVEVQAWLLQNNIEVDRRAETLSINAWVTLTKTFPIISNRGIITKL